VIKRVWAKNYRSLANIEVDLEPITVLVGQNGSGKSNFVDVFRFVYDACRMGMDAAIVDRHGMSALRRWSAKGRPYDVEIGLMVEDPAWLAHYSFILGSERRGEYRVKREICQITSRTNNATSIYETSGGAMVRPPDGINPVISDRSLLLPLIATAEPYDALYEYLTSFAFYNIFPNTLTEPQKPANPYPLDEHGSNLASTLREMQRTRDPLLAQLRDSLQTVLPDVMDFQVSQVGGYLVTRLRHLMSTDDRASFELSQESDGTLRMLGILVALHQGAPRTLLTLEEPELTIHPGALRLLWDEIEAAASRSQIVITTHSPDLLDLCTADKLRVVEKVNGATLIDPIEEQQKQAIQERLFAPGELLRAHGLRRAEQLALEL
jgi:predicted ATPase